MKKFIAILSLALVVLSAVSCDLSYVDELDYHALDVTKVGLEQGRMFASYPYVGTTYENMAEIVTFSGNRVSVGFGDAELQKDRIYGDWHVDASGKKILFDDLAIYDQMTGKRYKLLEAEIGKRSDGLYVLHVGYDKGYGQAEYDPAFVYVEFVTMQPTVSPWSPEVITVM